LRFCLTTRAEVNARLVSTFVIRLPVADGAGPGVSGPPSVKGAVVAVMGGGDRGPSARPDAFAVMARVRPLASRIVLMIARLNAT
jgi:hypothetical protein